MLGFTVVALILGWLLARWLGLLIALGLSVLLFFMVDPFWSPEAKEMRRSLYEDIQKYKKEGKWKK